MPIRHVLWDHDGIIVDTEPIFFEATARVMAKHGIRCDADRWAALQDGGRGIGRLLDEAGLDGRRRAEVRGMRDELYAELLAERSVLIPGARRTVETVTERFRSAMVTTSLRRYVDQMHRRSGLLDHFEHIVTAEDCARHKPHPEPYLHAMELLGATPETCVAIEDSPRGLASALAAGVRCVVVRTDFIAPERLRGADHVLESIQAFGPWLDGVSTGAVAPGG